MEADAFNTWSTGISVDNEPVLPHRGPVQEGEAPSPAVGMGIALAAGAAPALFLAIAMARGGASNPWVLPLAALTLCINLFIVLLDLRYGLALFIVAAGLSPKLPGVYNNLRVEDFTFVLVFGIWLLRGLQGGRIQGVRSPIVLPFLLLTLISVLSTLYGLALGTVPDPQYSIFLQAKRIEYFLIFWVVATTVRSEAWLRLLVVAFIASGAIAALYGLGHAHDDEYLTVAAARVTGPEGENYNTLSGYLVVCIGAGLAAIPGFRRLPRTFLIGCTVVAGLGLLLSYSREGYLMLIGSVLVFGFTRHRWLLLLAGLALVAALIVAEPVRQNVNHTVQMVRDSQQANPGENSLTARYRAWADRWNGWYLQQPLIGNGVGSVALSVDNEYLLRACEVGTVGFIFFAWWLIAIWQQIQRLKAGAGFIGLLASGLAAGFVGLLIQGFVAASFTTIRTMEPFWFLLGLVTAAAALRPCGAQGTVPCAY